MTLRMQWRASKRSQCALVDVRMGAVVFFLYLACLLAAGNCAEPENAAAAAQAAVTISAPRSGEARKVYRLDDVGRRHSQPWLSGLPPLSYAHSPAQHAWNNSFAICAIIKDEIFEDVQEWLAYHRWLGVDHVYLTDNGSHDRLRLFHALSHAFPDTFLTLRTESAPHGQLKVYAWCAEELRARYNWLAFIDVDEYIFVRRLDRNAPRESFRRFMNAYKAHAGLSVHWRMMGPSGREFRPKGGGVLRHYDQCTPWADRVFKTIVNTYFLEGLTLHPHNFVFRDGRTTVDELGRAIEPEWKGVITPTTDRPWRDLCIHNIGEADRQCRQAAQQGTLDAARCRKRPRWHNSRASGRHIVLLHYFVKSLEDFKLKMERGSATGKPSGRTMADFDRLQEKQRSSDVCREATRFAELCCPSSSGTERVTRTVDSHLLAPSAAPAQATATIKRLEANELPLVRPWVSDLPPMPASHAPRHVSWNNSMAVCVAVRDERIEDIIEWLRYYRWLGVDHVYMTDNGSADGEGLFRNLQRSFAPSFLTLRGEAVHPEQMKAYAWCAEVARWRHNWLAFFDVDEYLVLRHLDKSRPRESLTRFLDEYKGDAGLAVHWIWVGPSGHTKRVPGGGVLAHYDQCSPTPSSWIKTIANTYYLSGLAWHPHNVVHRGGRETVDENHMPIGTYWKALPAASDDAHWREHGSNAACRMMARGGREPDSRRCLEVPKSLTKTASTEKVALFHYVTKSREDFEDKMRRGSGVTGQHGARNLDFFAEIQGNQTRAAICAEPVDLAPLCCARNSATATDVQQSE